MSVIHPREIRIEAQNFEPIRMGIECSPMPKHDRATPGVYIYDFGQNMAGVERLSVSGPVGTDVQVRAGEALNPDGTLYTDNLRTAKATDHFILSGKGIEALVPHFTFHGFRYVEITGLRACPSPSTLTALVLHTDFPFTAKLTTGNDMVNKLWSNILWGERIEFCGVTHGLSAT